jgi:hypothetical protein
MKRKKIEVLLALLGVALFFFLTRCDSNAKRLSREEYEEAKQILNEEASNVYLYSRIIDFFYAFNRYPRSLDELDSIFEISKYDARFSEIAKDPFSRDESRYLYIPLYKGRNKDYPIGFYLLSSGMDGDFDNKDLSQGLLLKDTSELEVYNRKSLSYEGGGIEKQDLILYRSFGDESLYRTRGVQRSIEELIQNEAQFKNKLINLDISLYKDDKGGFYGYDNRNESKVVIIENILNKEAFTKGNMVKVKGLFKKALGDSIYFSKVIIQDQL